jgi:hypothetical protein
MYAYLCVPLKKDYDLSVPVYIIVQDWTQLKTEEDVSEFVNSFIKYFDTT